MTRSSQPVPNSMHNVLSDSRDPFVPPCFKYYAQCTVPENDDRVACSIFFRMTFSLLVTCGNFQAKRGHPLPAADNFLPERDPGSACRHGPSRATAAMGRHEQLPSWAVTSDSAPNLPRASRRRRKSANLDGDVLLSVWIEDKTSASWSTATAMGSCIGRSRVARKRPQPPVRRKEPSPASLLR